MRAGACASFCREHLGAPRERSVAPRARSGARAESGLDGGDDGDDRIRSRRHGRRAAHARHHRRCAVWHLLEDDSLAWRRARYDGGVGWVVTWGSPRAAWPRATGYEALTELTRSLLMTGVRSEGGAHGACDNAPPPRPPDAREFGISSRWVPRTARSCSETRPHLRPLSVSTLSLRRRGRWRAPQDVLLMRPHTLFRPPMHGHHALSQPTAFARTRRSLPTMGSSELAPVVVHRRSAERRAQWRPPPRHVPLTAPERCCLLSAYRR